VWISFLVAVMAVPSAPPSAVPCTRYYFTLFAGQSVPFRPRTGHTWATYAKATTASDGAVTVESLTISWLPANGHVQPLNHRPVAGKNFSLEETFALMQCHNASISHWGPYEIDGCRYNLAQEQVRHLESGAARYRAVDSFNLNTEVINCVHAITHASPTVRNRIQPVIRVGEPGTSRLAKLYVKGGAFPGYPETHDWILAAIGADKYATTKRQPGEYIPRRDR
jgi:hypothetical protein